MSMTLASRSHQVHQVSARSGPGRVASSGRPGASSGLPASLLAWFRRKLLRRPGTTLAHCAFALAGVLVMANALMFQAGSGKPPAHAMPAAAPQPEAVPVPPQRPSALAPAAPAALAPKPQAAPSAVQPSARVAPPREAAAREVAPRDAIGDLIRTGQVPAAQPAPASPAAPESRPVLAAQRALNRLGHGPVRMDGAFGEETRAAIERFERDRRIPVTRELSPRTLRELTAASGMRME